jgi:hypothetical protein
MRGVGWIVATALVAVSAAVPSAWQTAPRPESGLWHLVAANESEVPLPQHRVDIRLYMTSQPMRAAMVNRATGEDMLPFSLAEFDGETLRLGRRSEVAESLGQLIVLEMRWDGTRFTGRYVDEQGTPVAGGVDLKLVKPAQ